MQKSAHRACLLVALATIALSAPAFPQSFYGHDRGWGHGHMTPNGMVPDDYLTPTGGGTDITRSSNPWGTYAPAGQQRQMQSGRPVYYYRPSKRKHAAKRSATASSSGASTNSASTSSHHKPRTVYYSTPGWTNGVYHGQPLIQGDSGRAFSLHGRGQY